MFCLSDLMLSRRLRPESWQAAPEQFECRSDHLLPLFVISNSRVSTPLLVLREAALGPGEPPLFCSVYSKGVGCKFCAFHHRFCLWQRGFAVGLAETFPVACLARSQLMLCDGCHCVCCLFPPLTCISCLKSEMCPQVLQM